MRHLKTPNLILTLILMVVAGGAAGAASTAPGQSVPAAASQHAAKSPQAATSPQAAASQPAPGFSSGSQTMFAFVVQFAPPGPNRPARAIEAFSRQLDLQRKITFHPQLGDNLQKVVDQLPPRQSTLIRAAALYSRDDIPWNELPDGVHQISVSGAPKGSDFLYSLTHKYVQPQVPSHMAGAFTLKPVGEPSAGDVSSVIGGLAGELVTNSFGVGETIDALSAILRELHGDLQPPWDTAPGEFNQYDRVLLARFHQQMPVFADRLEHYLKIDNLIDEFDGAGGPVVLFNLDAEVRQNALKPYPHLYEFYRKLASALHARSAIVDEHGNYWMLTKFEGGHIHLTFMDRAGMLVPFNKDFRPAGAGIVLSRVTDGHYRTQSSVIVRRLGMNFGLDDLDFATSYRRTAQSVALENRMEAVPDLVAPPVIHGMMLYIAGEFLRVMAQGDGGFRAQFGSQRTAEGLYRYAVGFRAEFNYSPTLEFLAKVGDAIAEAHNEQVRIEERQVGLQLFDAFVTDYNNARPAILALDTKQEGSK